MTNANAKSFTTSRRSILKGLGAAAIGISLVGKKSAAWADEEKKLNFYNWDTYTGETTLEDFKNASGIDVNMSLFATNDELFAKLRAGNPGYDVIVPGSEFVERMRPPCSSRSITPRFRTSKTSRRSSSTTRPTIPAANTACRTPGS